MEKLCFLSDSLEFPSCHFSTRPRVAHQTSLNQTPIGKRGIKTILNHFGDKSARFFAMELDSAASKSWENSEAQYEEEKLCTPLRFRSFLGMKQNALRKTVRNQPAARAVYSFGQLHYRDTPYGRSTVPFLFYPTTEKPSKVSVGVSVWNGVLCESLPMSTRFWNPL